MQTIEIIVMITMGLVIMFIGLAAFLMFGPRRFENKSK